MTAMTTPDMREGEVLWIDTTVIQRNGCPNGFPFRVVRFCGPADGAGKFWVRGVVLNPANSLPVDEVTIPIPLTQQRAVRRGNALRERRSGEPEEPAHPAVAVAPVPAPYHARRDVNEATILPSGRRAGEPPAGYRRAW